MTPIEAALAVIILLEPGESVNYTFFANKYGVSRSTLSRRHRGVQRSRDYQYEEQRILTN
jgi:hypothetical protein